MKLIHHHFLGFVVKIWHLNYNDVWVFFVVHIMLNDYLLYVRYGGALEVVSILTHFIL